MKPKFSLTQNNRQVRLKKQVDRLALIKPLPYQIKFTSSRDGFIAYTRSTFTKYKADKFTESHNHLTWSNRKSPFVKGLAVWCTVVPYSKDNQPLLDMLFSDTS